MAVFCLNRCMYIRSGSLPLASAARRFRAPQTRRGVCVFWYMPALWRAHVGLTRGRRTSAARPRHTECRATCALILQCAAARIQVRAHATRPASLHPPGRCSSRTFRRQRRGGARQDGGGTCTCAPRRQRHRRAREQPRASYPPQSSAAAAPGGSWPPGTRAKAGYRRKYAPGHWVDCRRRCQSHIGRHQPPEMRPRAEAVVQRGAADFGRYRRRWPMGDRTASFVSRQREQGALKEPAPKVPLYRRPLRHLPPRHPRALSLSTARAYLLPQLLCPP
mmetsp:Transcript_30056/g.75283  ORF Transcript_30056/g.75283 Transcript_30056/m.75283 type:complete len:277 (+) Transcript_30056:1258-2088(+)